MPVSSGNAITISAEPNDAVELHGLTVDGSDVGNNGIVFTSGTSLIVVNCVVRDMTSIGLDFLSTATTPQTLAVSNSYFNNNAVAGIKIATESSGAVNAAIDRTGFYGNLFIGLIADGEFGARALNVAVTDSVAAHNNVGFAVQSAQGHSLTTFSVTHSLVEGNVTGFQSSGTGLGNAAMYFGQSTLTGNGTVANNSAGGVILSYSDNYLGAGNGLPQGTIGTISKM